MHKLINKQKEKTIKNHSTFGPTFGNGSDLIIFDQSNSSEDSFANIGKSYCNDAHYPYGQSSSWQKFSGDSSS